MDHILLTQGQLHTKSDASSDGHFSVRGWCRIRAERSMCLRAHGTGVGVRNATSRTDRSGAMRFRRGRVGKRRVQLFRSTQWLRHGCGHHRNGNPPSFEQASAARYCRRIRAYAPSHQLPLRPIWRQRSWQRMPPRLLPAFVEGLLPLSAPVKACVSRRRQNREARNLKGIRAAQSCAPSAI